MSTILNVLAGLGALFLLLLAFFGVLYSGLYVVVSTLFRSKPKGE